MYNTYVHFERISLNILIFNLSKRLKTTYFYMWMKNYILENDWDYTIIFNNIFTNQVTKYSPISFTTFDC